MWNITSECADYNIAQHGGPDQLTGTDDPRSSLQDCEGLAAIRCLDDGDIQCHLALVLT